jgi:hypothetical protein
MPRISLLLLFLFSAASITDIFRDYRVMQEGYASFEKHAYPHAEAKFQELIRLNPRGRDAEAAAFNLACTWYMQGKYPQASLLFAKLPQQRDLKLKSVFNQGNTLAMSALSTTEKSRKLQLLRSSLDLFKSVLLQNPKDGDAKINYEIVRRAIQEIEQPPPPSPNGPGGGGRGTDRQNGVNSDMADRLLDKVQEDESSLMRQLPGQGKSDARGKNEKDW